MIQGDSEHTEKIRARILDSAKELLARDGYSKTTIRKIVEHSGVLTGSIYYLFKNKEEIFKAMLLELTRDCIKKIHVRCKEESPLFKYAAVCEVELRVLVDYPVVRGTYFAGYSSKSIFEGMIEQFMGLAQTLFDGTEYACTAEAYYENTLMVKGAMHACLTELYFGRKIHPARSRQALLAMALRQFGAGKQEAQDVIRRVQALETLWTELGKELVEHPLGETT